MSKLKPHTVTFSKADLDLRAQAVAKAKEQGAMLAAREREALRALWRSVVSGEPEGALTIPRGTAIPPASETAPPMLLRAGDVAHVCGVPIAVMEERIRELDEDIRWWLLLGSPERPGAHAAPPHERPPHERPPKAPRAIAQDADFRFPWPDGDVIS